MTDINVLTDLEMTRSIWNHTKGDAAHKKLVQEEWLQYSLDAFEAAQDRGNPELFLTSVNKWMRDHKIPIHIQNFYLMTEDAFETSWEIEILPSL